MGKKSVAAAVAAAVVDVAASRSLPRWLPWMPKRHRQLILSTMTKRMTMISPRQPVANRHARGLPRVHDDRNLDLSHRGARQNRMTSTKMPKTILSITPNIGAFPRGKMRWRLSSGLIWKPGRRTPVAVDSAAVVAAVVAGVGVVEAGGAGSPASSC